MLSTVQKTGNIDLVHGATSKFTPASGQIPVFLWTTVLALNKVHAVWRWYRRYQVYTQPQSMAQLFAGHFADQTMEEKHVLRVAAQVLLIATRILACVQAQEDLKVAYDTWNRSIKGQYVTPSKVKWRTAVATEEDTDETNAPNSEDTITRTLGKVLSPSTCIWVEQTTEETRERIHRIALTTMGLAWSMTTLSMRIMDALDAINWTPESRREAMGESFVNIGTWLDQAASNKEQLLRGIDTNKAVIEYVFAATPIRFETLRASIASTLTASKHAKTAYEHVFSPLNKIVESTISYTVKAMKDFYESPTREYPSVRHKLAKQRLDFSTEKSETNGDD